MTWEDIWTTIGWGVPEFRAGLLAGAQIASRGIPESTSMTRADRRHMARLRAIGWMASGGELLDDAMPDVADVWDVLCKKDHGPYYCLIDHPKALDALREKLRDAARAR